MTREQMKEAIDKLKALTSAFERANDGVKLYEVPITYDNHHNGNDEHSTQRVWAKSKDRAIDQATIGPNGRWCSVDGPVTVLSHVPEITEELLAAVLALPDPL